MIQVIPQTRDEKIAMYLKLTKRELAEMLTSANEHLDRLPQQPQWQTTIPWETCPATQPEVTTTWSPITNLLVQNHNGGGTYQ